MVRFTTRQSAVDELRRLVVDGIYRDHFLGPKNFRCRGQGTPPSGVPPCSGSYNFLKRLYPAFFFSKNHGKSVRRGREAVAVGKPTEQVVDIGQALQRLICQLLGHYYAPQQAEAVH